MRNLFANKSWKSILWGAVSVVVFAVASGEFSEYMPWSSDVQDIKPVEGDSQAGRARVDYVVDGDTVVLEGGVKIRLLGIDTPERGEPYYDVATDRLKELVAGKDVILKRDVSETDRYGRGLRHIYVGDTWVNEIMISEGLARMVTYPPDVAHKTHFRALQREALENKRGLWQNIGNKE